MIHYLKPDRIRFLPEQIQFLPEQIQLLPEQIPNFLNKAQIGQDRIQVLPNQIQYSPAHIQCTSTEGNPEAQLINKIKDLCNPEFTKPKP